MKHVQVIMLALCAAVFTSCHRGSAVANSSDMKEWLYKLYLNSLDEIDEWSMLGALLGSYDNGKDPFLNEFVAEVKAGHIAIDGIDSDDLGEDPFADECIALFRNVCGAIKTQNAFAEALSADLGKDKTKDVSPFDVDFSGWEFDTSLTQYEFLPLNPDRATKTVRALGKAYQNYFHRKANERVKIINWDYDPSATGDAYTGYLVEYDIAQGEYYMLVQIIEYDDNDRYSAKVIASAETLNELHSY